MSIREDSFTGTVEVGGVRFIDCPGFYVAGPKVWLPDDAVLYPSTPHLTVADAVPSADGPTSWHRFVVQSGDALGVGHRLAVFDRTMPVRWASDDGSGPLNPVPVTTREAAAHLIKGRLAVASTPPASIPSAGGVDGAAGPDVDAPGNAGVASPAASVTGMVGEQSRPGGPPLTRHTQEFLHDPDAGTVGDCHRAAVASLFGFAMARVPHFALYGLHAERDVDRHGWWWAFVGWCASLEPAYTVEEGLLRDVDLPEPSDDPADLLGCYLLGGPSPRGVEHFVVGRGGEVVWDPHPSRGGLTEATSAVVLRRAGVDL